MAARLKQRAAVLLFAQSIEANGVHGLEDVTVLAVLRRAAKLLDEPLNFLETGDDPLLDRRAARSFFASASTRKARRRRHRQ